MNSDRNEPCTIGHLEDGLSRLGSDLRAEMADMRAELRADMAALEIRLEHRLTREIHQSAKVMMQYMHAEIAQSANVMMEHMTSLFRAAYDRTKAVEDRLDAHVADASVHRRPTRSRRS
jgi:hypothetical protein